MNNIDFPVYLKASGALFGLRAMSNWSPRCARKTDVRPRSSSFCICWRSLLGSFGGLRPEDAGGGGEAAGCAVCTARPSASAVDWA